jgi:DNA-binding MarR family transcriptional regulator
MNAKVKTQPKLAQSVQQIASEESSQPTLQAESPASDADSNFYKAESYTASESMGYLMRRSITLMSQEVERRLEPSGLTNAQWLPLLKLHLGDGGTVAELARGCNLDAGSMTRLLDRLETKDLCRRVRSSEDRRVVNLELTEHGRQAAQVIPEVLSRVQNEMLAGFTVDEWQLLKSFLRRILDTAQTMQADSEKTRGETRSTAEFVSTPRTTS